MLFFFSVLGAEAQQQDSLPSLHQVREHIQLYQYEQAVSLLLLKLAADTTSVEARWLLGQCYSQLGRTPGARQELEKLLSQSPVHKPARALLGQLYLKETNYRKAADCFDQLLGLDSTNAYFYRQRAYAAEKGGDIAAALYHYQKAIERLPQDIESITALAELWVKLAETGKAKPLVQEGLVQDSSNLRLWRLQMKLAYKDKDYAQAVKAMDYPLAAGDTSFYYLQLLGISHFHLSNYKEAISWFEFLEQEGVETEVLYYYMGLSYRNAGARDKGIKYLERAAKKGVSENLSHYYTQMAVTYEEQGDYKNAIRAYQQAYKISGERKLLYHLARNYDQHYKDKRVALNYYEKYLTEVDTVNAGYQDYARYRAGQLKEYIHFSADTL